MSAVCRPPMDLTTGIQKAKKRSAGTCGGRSSALACGAIGTGHATAARISAPIATHIVGAGGSSARPRQPLHVEPEDSRHCQRDADVREQVEEEERTRQRQLTGERAAHGLGEHRQRVEIRAPSCARYWPEASHTIT